MLTNDHLKAPRPRFDDLPIPQDVAEDGGWSEFMSGLAGQIGAYKALMLIKHVGGQRIHVPHPMPDDWFAIGLIGKSAAEAISLYLCKRNEAGDRNIGHMVSFPVAENELNAARLHPIIQAIRAKTMSYNEAAWMTGYSVRHLCYIASATARGRSVKAFSPKKFADDPRQITIFDVIEEAA